MKTKCIDCGKIREHKPRKNRPPPTRCAPCARKHSQDWRRKHE